MDPFEIAVLSAYVERLDMPSQFLLGTFFPGEQYEPDSTKINFDVQEGKPRIAPFVSPLVAGQVVESEGDTAKSFKPAYVKDKRVLVPNGPLKRYPGEQFPRELTPMQRRQLRMNRELRDQRLMLDRRLETMAAEFLVTGKETIKGERYPTQVVDFQRDPTLTKALTGPAAWDQAGVNPLRDIEQWAGEIQRKSGAVCRDVVFDPLAWDVFRENEFVKDKLDTRRGSQSTAETGPISYGQGNEKARRVGMVGDFELWSYQDIYTDPDDGTDLQMLPDNSVVMACRSGPTGQDGLMGVKAFAAIQDEEAEYEALQYFAKTWLEKDPGVRYLLLQCAPLVVPYRPNASHYAKVIP